MLTFRFFSYFFLLFTCFYVREKRGDCEKVTHMNGQGIVELCVAEFLSRKVYGKTIGMVNMVVFCRKTDVKCPGIQNRLCSFHVSKSFKSQSRLAINFVDFFARC